MRANIAYNTIQNKFIMQALKDIPRVLQKMEDLHMLNSPDQVLAEYKRNFKQFVQALTNEVLQMIQKYQSKISELTKQNQQLKQTQPFVEALSPIKKFKSSPLKKATPPKQFKCIDMMPTAKSKVFGVSQINGIENGALFSTVLAKYKKSQDEDNQFPIELISGNNGESGEFPERKSRFITKSNVKKQKEEELRHYLQARSKNLQKTTRQLLTAIGRDNKDEEQSQNKKDQLNGDKSDSSLLIKKNEQNLNKSLGNICESLDTSFHSRKARSKNAKKRQQIQEDIKKKQKQDEEVAKMLKDRGVKNLLLRLRDNVQNSKNPPEIIKNSRLISCGKGDDTKKKQKQSRQNAESPSLSNRRNSKVMINPVPVDIAQKSRATRKDNAASPTSPQKKPHSILKNSTVLSRSLSGISAIQFV